MENNGLCFTKKRCNMAGMEEDAFQVTVLGDVDDYLCTVEALLGVVGAAPDESISQEERYLICKLIKNMLPSHEQLQSLKDTQKNNSNL
jgi:hypothetical protein